MEYLYSYTLVCTHTFRWWNSCIDTFSCVYTHMSVHSLSCVDTECNPNSTLYISNFMFSSFFRMGHRARKVATKHVHRSNSDKNMVCLPLNFLGYAQLMGLLKKAPRMHSGINHKSDAPNCLLYRQRWQFYIFKCFSWVVHQYFIIYIYIYIFHILLSSLLHYSKWKYG